METACVSFNPPRTCAVKMTRGPRLIASFAGAWHFEEFEPGRTRVRFRYHLRTRPRWLSWLLTPIAARVFARDTRKRLEALRAAVEERGLLRGTPGAVGPLPQNRQRNGRQNRCERPARRVGWCVAHNQPHHPLIPAPAGRRSAMTGFWSEIIDDHTGPTLTDAMVQKAEAALGYKLPRVYVELLRTRNGGYPRHFCFPTAAPTSWATDHARISTLFGIGYKMGIESSPKIVSVWGYPRVGVVIADTPTGCHDAVMLDYSECGPKAEPRVILVETAELTPTVTVLAPNFKAFIAGLTDCAEFKPEVNDGEPGA
jgi:hypothetical protein